MKEIKFDPYATLSNVGAAASAATSTPVYFDTLDNTRAIKATLDTTGSGFFGATLSVKFQDSDTKSSYADVSGGGFTDQTTSGSETITFNLGSNVHIGTQKPNYGKYLVVNYSTSGGDSGGTTDIDGTITLENVFAPDDKVIFKL